MLVCAQTYNQLLTACDNFLDINTAPCQQAIGVAANEVPFPSFAFFLPHPDALLLLVQIGNVNIYDIYADCINNPTLDVRACTFATSPLSYSLALCFELFFLSLFPRFFFLNERVQRMSSLI